jgi:hypothetical protein
MFGIGAKEPGMPGGWHMTSVNIIGAQGALTFHHTGTACNHSWQRRPRL